MRPRIVRGKVRPPAPKEAIVAVNYHCNARCRMCDIWQLRDAGSLSVDAYAKLPSSLRNVGITGGEPFLRRDLAQIIECIHETCGAPQIIINTNGYLTQRIVDMFSLLRRLSPEIGIRVSLDGIGKIHDEMRGTRHAFRKVIRTLKALKQIGARNLGVSFTATNHNVSEITKVYELTRELGVQFAGTVAHNSNIYFHHTTNDVVDRKLLRQAYEIVNRRELTSTSVKKWFRAYFNHGIIEFNEHRRRLTPCSAASDFFYLDPHGRIYPCLIVPIVIGNLKEAPFDEIWHGGNADLVRHEVEGCEQCWMMCTARTSLRKRPLGAALWVAREKARLLFGDRVSADGSVS